MLFHEAMFFFPWPGRPLLQHHHFLQQEMTDPGHLGDTFVGRRGAFFFFFEAVVVVQI